MWDWILAVLENKRWRLALTVQAGGSLAVTAVIMALAVARRGGASWQGILFGGLVIFVAIFLVSVAFTARAVPAPQRSRATDRRQASAMRGPGLGASSQILVALVSCAASFGFWYLVYPRPGEMIVTALALFLLGRWAWATRSKGHRKGSDETPT